MQASTLKTTFGNVVRYAMNVETDGHTMSRDFFIPGSDRDVILKKHTDLVAGNSQYGDLYRAFKATGEEINAHVAAIPLDQLEELAEMALKGESELGPEASALEAKFEQREDALFAIYQQALTL